MERRDFLENRLQPIEIHPELALAAYRQALHREWFHLLRCKEYALKFLAHHGYERHTRGAQRRFIRHCWIRGLKLARQNIEPKYEH